MTFPSKTLILIRLVQCLSYSRDQKFVTPLVQSAITCTQEWDVVQYLVNKANMDSFQKESLSSIMKIAPYTVTHLFWSISPNSHCTSLWNKMNCITKPQQRISSVAKSAWVQSGRYLNMTEKWKYCLCPANSFAWLWWTPKMAVLSPAGDIKIVSPISTFMLNTLTLK